MKKIFGLIAATAVCAAIVTGCTDKLDGNNSFSGVSDATVSAGAICSVDDLKGKTIGVHLGTTGDIFAEDIEDSTVEKFNKGADAVQALKQGKVDAVIIDNEPAKVFVSMNDDLQILDEPFVEEEYAIAVKKGNDELTNKINTAIDELEADGTLDAIKANWIGDEAGQNPYVSPDDTKYPNGTLVMATNAEFPPYESLEGEDVVGLDVDMMKAICDKLGYELKIENMHFDSIIAAVNSDKADVGVAGMTVTEERLKNVNFSKAYTKATQVIIIKK